MGAVLTAMWFDPLERPVIWRWASDDALNRGTEAVLRRQHEQLEREIEINSSSRREAVERAALAVELAVGAGEDDVHQSGDVSGRAQAILQPPYPLYTASPPFPNPCASRRWTGNAKPTCFCS